MNLRLPQQNALKASLAAMERKVYRQVIVAATGIGKTVIFANLAEHHGITKRVLVLVHTEELADQAAKKIAHWNPHLTVGVEMGSRRALPTDHYVVGSVQTLGRAGSTRLEQFVPAEFGLVISDECHHSTSEGYKRIYNHFGILEPDQQNILSVGVTATPRRGDKVGLAQVFDEIVFQYPIYQAIKEGWLVDVRGYRVRTGVKLDDVTSRAGDFAQNELSATVNNQARNNLVVDKWLELASGKQTVGFCVDIAHAKDQAKAFQDRGVKAEAIWGVDPDREAKLKRHRSKEFAVLLNAQLLTEGYDDSQIECIILGKPTQSPVAYPQMLGRGLRLPDGVDNLLDAMKNGVHVAKQCCIVIDVVDNTAKHSLQTVGSVFGLPAAMDLKGASVVKAVDKVQALAIQNPTVEFDECEDFTKIESYIEQVDLFKVHFSQEVLDNSEFQWHKTLDGYRLNLPNREYVEIKQNVLRFSIKGKVEGAEFEGREDTIEEAFHYADGMLRRLGRKLINMLRRESKAKWAKDPVTPQQMAYLGSMLKIKGLPIPDWNKMTKHEASVLLGKMRASGWGKKGKAA